MWPAQPDPLSAQFTLPMLVSRLQQLNLHWDVLKGMAGGGNFGAWLILPTPFLLAHIVVARREISSRKGYAPWLTPALAISAALAGYYMVYMLTPYELSWHIGSSFNRLLMQLWPSALLLYAMIVASPPRPSSTDSTALTGIKWWTVRGWVGKLLVTYVVLAAAALGLFAIARWRPLPSEPHLELSASEVAAGRDSYVLAISDLPNETVTIQYSIDDGPLQAFLVTLDSKGEIRFEVPATTRKGKYRFLRFQKGLSSWRVTDRAITVK